MKIIYVSNAIIPSRTANSIHVMKMCQAIAQNGHDVILLVPNKLIEANEKDIFSYYGVEKVFQIKKLSWRNTKGRAYIYGWEVSKYIRSENPDYVYGRFLHGCVLISLLNDISVAYEAHTPITKFYERIIFKMMVKRKKFQKIVVISKALKDY